MARIKLFFKKTIFFRSFNLLSKKDQIKIIFVLLIQFLLGILDLIGVAILGFIGALSFSGVQSQAPGHRTLSLLNFFGLEKFSFQNQVAFLAVIAVLIFVGRTAVSIVLLRKSFYFLSRRGADLSTNIFTKLMSNPLSKINERSTQETLHSILTGVDAIVLVLAISINLFADLSISIIMFSGLFLLDPVLAISALFFFGIVGFVLYLNTNIKAHKLGYINKELAISIREKIIEALVSFRELVVKNRRDYYSLEIKNNRFKTANVVSELNFLPSYSKYVIEAGMIVGAITIAGIEFMIKDAQSAIAILSIFIAASSRIAPATMRIQQSLIQIKGCIGFTTPTFELIEELKGINEKKLEIDEFQTKHLGFDPKLILDSVFYTYPGNSIPTINGVDLKVDRGNFLALVGPSGSGKTTLADIMLGLNEPSHGKVFISGEKPLDAIKKWPGAIGYVSQNVFILDGTIRDNVTFGYPSESITDENVLDALSTAQLSQFIFELPDGINTQVGERGTKISGGQRQRLGIARALLSKPQLLILDEATSSLDGQSEFDISTALKRMKGSVTILIIAHRLSTVREADQVVYLSKGKILHSGSFEELRQNIPDFDRQAELMGLN